MNSSALDRTIKSIKEIMPKTIQTCLWLIRLTTLITLGVVFLEYFNILPYISKALNPIFNLMGLPGEAALAFVSGYFANVYSAIAVMSTLNLETRTITILSAMILCAHNMITETAVQKKTGSSALRMLMIRTISAFAVGLTLNAIMPQTGVLIESASHQSNPDLWEMLTVWFYKTTRLIITMSILIFVLSATQRILAEFGVIRRLSKLLRPLMTIFGLPAKTSFLWIVANTLGLAYGAAVMIEEAESGKITKEDINLLNHHIGISHSNLEDLFLLTSAGAVAWWLLAIRWLFSIILVWELRAEMFIRKKFLTLRVESH